MQGFVKHRQPVDDQTAAIHDGVAGGVFAYYNHPAGFGVEQRFDPADFESLALFWSPGRRQVNLEMNSRVVALEPGEQAGYAYEVRYLDAPPLQP